MSRQLFCALLLTLAVAGAYADRGLKATYADMEAKKSPCVFEGIWTDHGEWYTGRLTCFCNDGKWVQCKKPSYKEYQITVENLSLAQPFSPVVVATHRPGIQLFAFNKKASPEIVAVAEDGNPQPLAQALYNNQDVQYSETLDPVPPATSITAKIKVFEGADYISLATMAVNTNDCFVAINGERLDLAPQYKPLSDFQEFLLPGLDAGSEENNELCSSIPGPACPPGMNVRSMNGEGFVHVHRGFHGVNEGRTGTLFGNLYEKDLSVRGTPLEAVVRYDWRNPLARVTITEL